MEEAALESLLLQRGLQNLVRRGNNFMASCPSGNHADRRPSWGIKVDAPHPHGCFSCGFRGKTLYSFLLMSGMSPREARILCGEDEAQVDTKKLRWETFKLKAQIKTFSEEELFPFYPTVRSDTYFTLRGLNMSTIRKLNLMHDIRQNRVVYPWYLDGNLILVTGRTLDANQAKAGAKIIVYTSGTEKRHVLYVPAREIKHEPLIVVEGEFDAAKVYEAGFENVVALGHSSLTQEQKNLMLNSAATELWVFTDDDKAGEKAWRTIEYEMKNLKLLRRIRYDSIRTNYAHLLVRGHKLDPGTLDVSDIRALLTPGGAGQLFPAFSNIMSCWRPKKP